ncbi:MULTISPECIES: hypothetical protein [Mediterranea]|uniref:hypothetical protein n=1 Tax=Mediterranea TaxID=1926659 RepID=UPI0020125968|nr:MULTISPECIES: hypothetical protein [Mediterranea]MCL1608093.1 hypothetical protein [Mediterranea sp. ET5]MDM8122960.1 hypothetical protein [Mediterranea massiliensis]MDM8197765.1 hypothetical protein [Mediterranea massiliensis]
MSKDVKFNIKLSIDGKEHIVEATTDVKHFAQELGIAETKGKRLRDSLLKFNGLVTLFCFKSLKFAIDLHKICTTVQNLHKICTIKVSKSPKKHPKTEHILILRNKKRSYLFR